MGKVKAFFQEQYNNRLINMVWVKREIVFLECPFCHKEGVETMYHPASVTANVTRSAVAKATRFYKVPEKYEVLNGCKLCGKIKKEIIKAMKDGVTQDKEKIRKRHEELKKMMEELKKERETT